MILLFHEDVIVQKIHITLTVTCQYLYGWLETRLIEEETDFLGRVTDQSQAKRVPLREIPRDIQLNFHSEMEENSNKNLV